MEFPKIKRAVFGLLLGLMANTDSASEQAVGDAKGDFLKGRLLESRLETMKFSDPTTASILLHMQNIWRYNNDPEYFLRHFREYQKEGISQRLVKDRLEDIVDKFKGSRESKLSSILKLLTEEDVRDYLGEEFSSNLFLKALKGELFDVFSVLLLNNPGGVLEQIVEASPEAADYIPYVEQDELDAIMSFWGVNKVNVSYLINTITILGQKHALLANQVKGAQRYAEKQKAANRLHARFGYDPVLAAQAIWLLAQEAERINRNYRFKDKKQAVNFALKNYIHALEAIKYEKIWQENTVLISNSELWPDGRKRFGNSAVQERIRSVSKLWVLDTASAVEQKKQALELLKKIASLTWFFDGHGALPGAVFLKDGQLEESGVRTNASTVSISVDEIAEAINERSKKIKPSENRLVIIISACYSGSFIRKIIEKLKDDTPKPVFISSSRPGQVSWSDMNNIYGSSFNESLLKSNTVADFLKNSSALPWSLGNSSIIIKRPKAASRSYKQSFAVEPHLLKELKFLVLK